MEEAAAVRRAATEATRDVAPAALRETIDEFVDAGSFVPGVLTLRSARAVAGADAEDLTERAAGVQLIYDGLRLTRELAHDDPWHDGDRGEADLAILAADVLVARGFYLLARTDAAEAAVGVVRAFGRDQTDRETADPAGQRVLDRNLEADVLDLALVAGLSAVDARPPDTSTLAASLAADCDDGFPTPEAFFADHPTEPLSGLSSDGGRPLNRND